MKIKHSLWPLALKSIILTSFVLAMSERASAEFRLATVDLNKILNESTSAKEDRKTLDQLTQQTKKKLDAKKLALTELEKKIKEKKLEKDSEEVKAFAEEVQKFNILVKESEEEIKKEFLKFNKSLTEKALKLINNYATKKNLDLVIDHSEKARGPVVFGDPGVDISAEILKEMDNG